MSNNALNFEKVLTAFQDYLSQDTCVEVVKTSRGYAVIDWDDHLNTWVQIEHCPSPADLQQALLDAMASFLKYCYTSGNRKLTDAEKQSIKNRLGTVSIG